jgi:hypothetical protein
MEGEQADMSKKTNQVDPFKPSVALLVKLGSIAVHTEEMLPRTGTLSIVTRSTRC